MSNLYRDHIRIIIESFLPRSRWTSTYINLIELRMNRNSDFEGVWHHILPKSLFPEFKDWDDFSWNQVKLTKKEHFVAHHLLYEIYERSGSMALAFKWMASISNDTPSIVAKQLNNWKYYHSDETKLKISIANKGKTRTEETRKKLSESHKGHKVCESARKKLRDANLGKVLAPEHKKKISNSLRGGKRSELSRSRMSESAKCRAPMSEETREKCRIAGSKLKGPQLVVRCPHCSRSGGIYAMKRYHFDKCKMKEN